MGALYIFIFRGISIIFIVLKKTHIALTMDKTLKRCVAVFIISYIADLLLSRNITNYPQWLDTILTILPIVTMIFMFGRLIKQAILEKDIEEFNTKSYPEIMDGVTSKLQNRLNDLIAERDRCAQFLSSTDAQIREQAKDRLTTLDECIRAAKDNISFYSKL